MLNDETNKKINFKKKKKKNTQVNLDEPSKPTIRVMRMKLSHKKQIKNNYEAQSLTNPVKEDAKKKKTHFKNTTQEKD
jgi:hypothetical protein